MPFLEIMHLTGDVDRRELSKQHPVTIGSHVSNDICIDEDNVEIMHARISWGKKGYEAVAAGIEGLDYNGTIVNKATLNPGDVLRFGMVDIRYRDAENDGGELQQGVSGGEVGLKAVSEEIPLWEQPEQTPQPKRPQPKTPSPPQQKPVEKKKQRPPEPDVLEDFEEIEDDAAPDFMGGLDALAAESLADVELPPLKPSKKRTRSEEIEELEEIEEIEDVDDIDDINEEESGEEKNRSSEKQQPEITDGMSDRMRRAMRASQARPGEEDPFRSPLVLGLAGSAVALLLTGAIFFFIANRQTVQDKFDAAKANYDEANYIQAIKKFADFELIYPKHTLTPESKRLRGLAAVRQMTEGAVPKFPDGLEELRKFISDQRDLENFETLHPDIVEQAKLISIGAAKAAGKLFDPTLLDIAGEARTILTTYSPKDTPPTETLNEIETNLRISTAAILEKGVYDDHLAQIEVALKAKTPLVALKKRQDLLGRYPMFAGDKKIKAKLAEALVAEKERVQPVAIETTAITEDVPATADLLTLAFQGRTRTDEVSVGNSEIALAKDCCYGIDFVTGAPVWRRVIGFDSPFFPLQETDTPSVVLFDSNRLELVRLKQASGELIWRLPINERVTGNPLLVDGTIYASTESGRLLAVDLQTGEIASGLQFSQPIGAAVQLKDGRLVVTGKEEVLYVLTNRPLRCESVSYFGQMPGSIEAPLLVMGTYILVLENTSNKANVHLVESDTKDKSLKVIATKTIEGNVLDAPVIRGRDLFIPSTGERISAFSVSNDPGQPALVPGPTYQGEGKTQSSMHLLTGPDRQLWMAMGNLDRLQLTTDSLQPGGETVSVGMATQPLLYTSGFLLSARKRSYADAITYNRTNRETLESDWQVVLGGKPLAWTFQNTNGLSLAVVNESGHAFRVGDKQLTSGKFLTDANRLPLHQDLATPLVASAVTGNRIAVACGGPEPRMWLINAAAQIEGSPQLPDAPQAPPASIGNRIVIPLPGRLHVVRVSGQQAAQDFALPTGENHPWLNLVSAGEDSGVAVTTDGLIFLLRLQTSPRLFLNEVTRLELGSQVIYPACSADGLVAIADTTNTVSLFSAERLDLKGKRTFPGAVTTQPCIAGGNLFVEEGKATLHSIGPTNDLASVWTFDLQGGSVAGITQLANGVLVAQQNGTISLLNPATGEVIKQQSFNMPIASQPFTAGEKTFAATLDGTLINLSKFLGP